MFCRIFSVVFWAITIVTSVSFAKESPLMVSIDKSHVQTDQEILQARQDLTFEIKLSNGCRARTTEKDYFPYKDAPYHGVSIVVVDYECEKALAASIERIESDGRYTNWANPQIEPF
ncbi:MAG: hypothetical protein IT289_02735 [Oligoflexia bacterium]|nr:hypothetical protein [Oligoflexia bacterium]